MPGHSYRMDNQTALFTYRILRNSLKDSILRVQSERGGGKKSLPNERFPVVVVERKQ